MTDLLGKPVPVRRLLRKQTGMLEVEGLQVKSQVPIVNAPLLRKIEKLPLAAASGAAVIVGIGLFPAA